MMADKVYEKPQLVGGGLCPPPSRARVKKCLENSVDSLPFADSAGSSIMSMVGSGR